MQQNKQQRLEGVITSVDATIQPVGAVSDIESLIRDEAFLNEKVTVIIDRLIDADVYPDATVSVNGVNCTVQCGIQSTIPRYFLEAFARTAPISSHQPQSAGREMGIEDLRMKRKFAFQITPIHDHSPEKGRAYLNWARM